MPDKDIRENPAVSIIILNYNGKHFLKECLDSISATEASRQEVIVVDNASSDGSPEYIKKEFPLVRLLELDGNYGYAKANNIAAEAAGGEYLVFLNNDTVVTPGWLDALLDVIVSDTAVAAAGSKLLLYHMPERLNSAGANIVFNGGGFDIGFMDTDSDRYNIPGPKGAVCGASMMVGKEEFLSLGGFDTMYFMAFEDLDLCWRFWLSGKKVVYVPGSVVYHRFSATVGIDRHSVFKVFYGTRNSMFNIFKNFEPGNLLKGLCFNLVFHTARFFQFIFQRPQNSWALLRAYGSFLRHIPEVLTKRKAVQSKRKIPDKYLFENSLVVPFSVARREHQRLKRAEHAARLGNRS